jgi:hypothetical protein
LQGPEEFILGIIFKFKEIFQHESQFTGSEPPAGSDSTESQTPLEFDSNGFQTLQAQNFRGRYALETPRGRTSRLNPVPRGLMHCRSDSTVSLTTESDPAGSGVVLDSANSLRSREVSGKTFESLSFTLKR